MFLFPHLINALDGSMSRNISSSVKRFKMGSYNADVRNNLAEKSSSVNDWNEIRGHKLLISPQWLLTRRSLPCTTC